MYGEEFRDAATDKRSPATAQELAEPLIAAQNAPCAIVDQDGIANGIERVFPLMLRGGDLFKQGHVLKRQTE